MVSNKITSDNMYMINKTDSDNFADGNDIFFMVNPSSRDEAFYEKSEKGLTELPGYVVYYERNEKMQTYMTEHRNETGVSEKSGKEDGRYRELIKERKNPVSRSVKKHLTLVYCLSMLLIIVVLIIGVNSINNYDGNNKNDKNGQQANAGVVTTEEETVPVETVPADVTTRQKRLRNRKRLRRRKRPLRSRKRPRRRKRPLRSRKRLLRNRSRLSRHRLRLLIRIIRYSRAIHITKSARSSMERSHLTELRRYLILMASLQAVNFYREAL